MTNLHCPFILSAVELLIKHGANIHARTEDGKTPLHEAFSDQYTFPFFSLKPSIEILVRGKAKTNSGHC